MVTPINRPNLEVDPAGDIAFLEEQVKRKEDEAYSVKKLAQYIHKVWTQNQKDFKPVRLDMVKALRRVKGHYEPEKLAAIKAFKGSEIFIRSGEAKCRAAESWIKDLYRAEADMPWDIEPTASPDLPVDTKEKIRIETQQQAMQFEQQILSQGLQINPVKVADMLQDYYVEKLDEAKKEMEKEAKERCERASNQIKDQNQEGGWTDAFKDFLYYFVRLKYAAIKGPILTKTKKQVWQQTAEGKYDLVATDALIGDVYSPSPFNLFPSAGIKHINDGDMIEVHELTRQAISDLLGVPGYSDEEIRLVIDEYDSGKLKSKWFTIDDETVVREVTKDSKQFNSKPITSNSANDTEATIRAQEFYGSVAGRLLLDWGMDTNLDPHTQYQVNCWKIGDHVIKAVINPDELGRKPYHISSWAKNPEWLVGEGLVEFAAPIEDAMNAVMRALINNVAIASGPMSEVDKDRVDTSIPIYPWRQIESTSMQMKGEGPAITYYQPQMHSQELTNVWQFLSKVLDEMTVPAYAQGASQSGVTAGTATVFTQLLAAASRSIKAVVANIDDDIISSYVQMSYDSLMKTTDDMTIKGDARVVAKGVTGLSAKEQQAQRKVEYLQTAANPAFSQILGAKNIGSVLAQVAKSNDIDLPDMRRLEGDPTVEQMVTEMLMAQAGVDPMQEGGQVAQGGGAPKKAQGTNPDGSKAGVSNAR